MATIITAGAASSGTGASGDLALLTVGAAMDLGARDQQEDALGVFLPGEETPARRGSLCVLADGMGGHNAGELASRLAVQTIQAAFYASPLRQPGNLLQSSIEQANRRILAAGQDPGLRGLGSTCVCAVVQGDILWVANVGDSRAYLLRPAGGLQQLSQDHSLAAEQVRMGRMSPAEAGDSDMNAVLLQSLGSAGGVQPHFAGPLPLQKGDLVLLCSDGLYHALDERAIQDYLLAALRSTLDVNPEQLARDLVEGARFRGALDNTSAIILYCTDVVPEAVARAGGWPQQQAHTLFLPSAGTTVSRGPAGDTIPEPVAVPPPAPSSDYTTAAVQPYLPAAGAAPSGLAPGRARTGVAPLTAVTLILALTLVALLLLAWTWAAFSAPQLLVPIFEALAAIALPTSALLFVGRPRTVAPPPLPLPTPYPEEPAPEPSRGFYGADPEDATRTLITRLLPDRTRAGRAADRGPAPDTGAAAPVPAPLPAAPAYPAVTTAPAPVAAPAPLPVALDPGSPDYVSQAMTEATNRARQQWTFNLLMAAISAALVIGGCLLTALMLLLGQPGLLDLLFGPGVGLLGVMSWLVTQPAAQLSRADNQISLLTIVWTNYAQELRACGRMTDPNAVAACNQRAGADAVQYFNQIIGTKTS